MDMASFAGFMVSGGRDGKLCYWRLEDGVCLRSVEVSEVSAGMLGHQILRIVALTVQVLR